MDNFTVYQFPMPRILRAACLQLRMEARIPTRPRILLTLTAHHKAQKYLHRIFCMVEMEERRVIDDKLSGLALLQGHTPLKNQVRGIMRQKANGTFLWVSLAVHELSKDDVES